VLRIEPDVYEALKVRIDKTVNVTSSLTGWEKYKNKITLFLRVLLIPFFVLGRKSMLEGVTVGPTSDSGETWNYFVKHYFKSDYAHIDNIKCSIFSFRFDIVILYLKMCLYTLKISGDVNQFWVSHLFKNIILYECYKGELEEVYIFYINHPSPFLFAKFVEAHKVKSIIHMGNNPIFKWNYPFPISSPIILSSAVQIEEIKYLNLPNKWQYCRDEFILFSKDVPKREPRNEIGLISSGEWARTRGLYRSSDLESISNHSLAKNKVYAAFEEGLKTLISLNSENKFIIKIYPHPFERELINSGIRPPYYKWVDLGYVELDMDGSSSREKIYDSKVAISYHSSFIWERISLGLENSYHFQFNDEELDLVDYRLLGNYKKNIFFRNDDIKLMIEKNT